MTSNAYAILSRIVIYTLLIGGALVAWDELYYQYAVRPEMVRRLRLELVARALQQYAAEHGHLPPLHDENGKRYPISWRVHLLPLLGYKELYEQFHLDEPWNSPHNLTLVSRMPTVFAYTVPGDEESQQGKTRLVAVIGQGSRWQEATQITMTAERLLVVVGPPGNEVVWTAPDDWDLDHPPRSKGEQSADGDMLIGILDNCHTIYGRTIAENITWNELIARGAIIGVDNIVESRSR
ncbi:MAG: hypothetical protein KatS3mg109_1874 [Pirellulaceae bacterium]|nr:MAG: hypothetical protein KatS3mg109_1874 [Pirellulaceae bacterium]